MHTFDIRFARSAGLAGLFEAPANRRRWKGAGKLSIHADGISIAMKRGLLTLFGRHLHRIPARELTEVYREGEALRLELGSADSREVLPIWANSSEAAAQIVKLLPTRQTVELEHSISSARAYRLDVRFFAVVAIGVVVVAALALVLARGPSTVEVPLVAAPSTPITEADATLPGAADAPAAPARPLSPSSPAWPAARRHVVAFEAESAALRQEFVTVMESPSPLRLEALALKWHEKLQAIHAMFGPQSGELVQLGNIQAAICISWREFLYEYAGGMRERNLERINAAFAAREQADILRDRMRWYVPD